jgi:hypothetical protein
MKLLFHVDQINVRGTCDAVYSYAHYNETMFGNKSVIVAPKAKMDECDDLALTKFNRRFEVLFYDDNEALQKIADDADCIYFIKYGKNDAFTPTGIRTLVHCVFDMTDQHGDVYAGVSGTLAKKFGKHDFVPHMISLQPSMTGENLRGELKIPEDAVVFGRHGGMDTFNLKFVMEAIILVVQQRDNIWFVFVNTPKFVEHPHVVFLDKICDPEDKNKYICTCDAHLEASTLGHTFGLSMGEFSVNNKPIIAYNGPVWNTAHFDILGDRALYFKTPEELVKIFCLFDPAEYEDRDMNCYKEYTAEKVMPQFKQVFLDN